MNSKHANVGFPLPEQKLQGIRTRGRARAPGHPRYVDEAEKAHVQEPKLPMATYHKRTVIPPDRVPRGGDTCPQGPSNMAAGTSNRDCVYAGWAMRLITNCKNTNTRHQQYEQGQGTHRHEVTVYSALHPLH